jgi:hypothetical protein
MGNIVDPTQYEKDQQALVAQRQSELDQELSEVREQPSSVPDKYKGKTLEEVIQMHQEAEREKSRLGNEVGQLRTQVLERPAPKVAPKKTEVNVDSLLENPEEAIGTVVKQETQDLKEAVEEIRTDRARREFETKYPEFKEDMKDEKFFEWIKKNPVRVGLAQSADVGDYQAADLLWDMWQEVKEVTKVSAKQAQDAAKAKRDKQLKDGMLESGTGNTVESKKVFRRSEITNLKTRAQQGDRAAMAIVNDPTWQQEVLRAYEQKRVI